MYVVIRATMDACRSQIRAFLLLTPTRSLSSVQMRIVQDLGLLSATGSAAAPTNPTQCGAQVEAALQAARQELSLRAASRGANAVFQTSYVTRHYTTHHTDRAN